MADQIVTTKQISVVLGRGTGEALVTISPPRLTAEALGVSAANNTLFSERYIQALKCRSYIDSLDLVAPPEFPLGLSDNQKLNLILQNEMENPHKLLQMLIKGDNIMDEWGEVGTTYFLNRGQSYNTRLSIFFTEGDFLEISGDASFAVRMVSDGYGVLAENDFIHIYGLYKEVCTVLPKSKNQITYTHNRITLAPNTYQLLKAQNSDRQYLRVANDGENPVWMQEGNGSASKVGAPIYPLGNFEWNWSYLETPLTAAIYAYSELGSTITVTEGK